jgi:hypothetical protein
LELEGCAAAGVVGAGAAGVNLQYRHHQAFEEPSAARLDAFFLFLLIYPAEKEED